MTPRGIYLMAAALLLIAAGLTQAFRYVATPAAANPNPAAIEHRWVATTRDCPALKREITANLNVWKNLIRHHRDPEARMIRLLVEAELRRVQVLVDEGSCDA